MDKDAFRELFEAALGARFPEAPSHIVVRFCDLFDQYLHWYRKEYRATLPEWYRRSQPFPKSYERTRPLAEAARAAGYEGHAFSEVMTAVWVAAKLWASPAPPRLGATDTGPERSECSPRGRRHRGNDLLTL